MSLSLLLAWVGFLLILALIAGLLWAAVKYIPLPATAPAWIRSLGYVLILVACAIAIADHAGLLHG